MSADVTSTVAQPATVRLFVNGELAGTKDVALTAGANRVDFLFTAKDAGFLRFRIAVEAARDTFNQNDRADANTIVKGEPRVLVVKGDEDVAAQLVEALKTERHQVDTVIPEALPVGPRRARGLRLRRARRRAPDPAHGQGDGRAPGVRPGPGTRARDDRRAEGVRGRRVHRRRRSRRRCPSTWACATARSSRTSRSSS